MHPMYNDLFIKHNSLKYEQLKDLVNNVQPGDFLTTSDDRSGYLQLDMHPDMWRYLGFQYKSSCYCFKVLTLAYTAYTAP